MGCAPVRRDNPRALAMIFLLRKSGNFACIVLFLFFFFLISYTCF